MRRRRPRWCIDDPLGILYLLKEESLSATANLVMPSPEGRGWAWPGVAGLGKAGLG